MKTMAFKILFWLTGILFEFLIFVKKTRHCIKSHLILSLVINIVISASIIFSSLIICLLMDDIMSFLKAYN